MTKYMLKRDTKAFEYSRKDRIKQGCSLNQVEDPFPILLGLFDNKEEPLKLLKECKTEIKDFYYASRPYYLVTEYYVWECKYDKNEELKSTKVLGITPMPKLA